MAGIKRWKRRISWILLLVLLLTPVMQVSAEELPENPAQSTELLEPDPTQAPETTEAPEVTEEPETTEAPEVTEEPETTEAPEVTEVPEATDEPEVTEVPEATDEPEVTEEPDPTEAPEVTEEPEITEAPEATKDPEIPMEQPMLLSLPRPVPIGEVLQLQPGSGPVTIVGTVVYADDYQAVLQDDTGGIRLSFETAPAVAVGDVLMAKGCRSGGFAVESYEKTGTGELPAVESTLQADLIDTRILVKGATLGRNSLSQNGYAYGLAEFPEGAKVGDRVDVWGVILDGAFHIDTIQVSESQTPEDFPDSEWNFYFGQLHAHTNLSDGLGTVQEAYHHAKVTAGLDFFAVTDHSNSFDNAERGAVELEGASLSEEWAAGKQAALDATDEDFVGIFGYEMTWPEDLAIGHINTFATPGWQTRDQPGMDSLEGYLQALEAVPDSVSQFNHPGSFYGDFYHFTQHDPRQDALVQLLEVGGEGSFTAYDAYRVALDAGWHLAPTNNQNNHRGNWGSDSSARTVVLARELTEEALYDALRHRRAYATEDGDLKIEYHLNDRVMGSVLPLTQTLTADIWLEDGSGDPIGRVEVITEGGETAAYRDIAESKALCSLELSSGSGYYYLRIVREGKTVAVTAPVWVDSYEDLGIQSFQADSLKPIQGAQTALTLTLYNHENLPFVVEQVALTLGEETVQTLYAPGTVSPVGTLEIPMAHSQATAGAVTLTARVTGRVGDLSRTYRQNITLRYRPPEAKLRTVEAVRGGNLGDGCRIRGYVTAGTANQHNMFPNSIYLQDDTGGIAVVDFTREGVQLGTPMEVEGILRSVGGNLVLAMTDFEILQEDYYRHVPRTMAHERAMDYDSHGGELLQVQGSVVSVTKTADQLGVSRFTLRDVVGDLATVMVEDGIGSGAYGTNELVSEVRKGSTVRAMGLLHIDEYGKPVLRVRNCDEVVYVPPVNDPSNPKTGDALAACLSRLRYKGREG